MAKPPNSSSDSKDAKQKTSSRAEWIFLRGLVRSADHWGEFPELFRAAFPGVTVRCLNLPGNGPRFKERSPHLISSMTDGLRAECGSHPNRFILSLSMGAMISIDWIARYPGDFKGAVLINTSASGVSPLYRRLQPSALLKIARIGATFDNERREDLILAMTSHLADRTTTKKRWAQVAELYPISRRNAVRQLVAAARFRVLKDTPAVPLLLLNSAGDQLCHPSCSLALSHLWKAPLRTHPTANHELPLDEPKWVIEQVLEWKRTLG